MTTYHVDLTVDLEDAPALRRYLDEFHIAVEGPGDDAEAVLAAIMHHVNRGTPSDPLPFTVTAGGSYLPL